MILTKSKFTALAAVSIIAGHPDKSKSENLSDKLT